MKARQHIPWLYSAPIFLVIGAVIIFPIINTLQISFTNMNVYHWFDYEYIGSENYQRVMFMLDSGFLAAIFRTILWTVLNIIIQVAFAFVIALGLNALGPRLSTIYKTLLMFPWAMPAYVSILLWRMGMFNTEFGFLNKVLKSLGYDPINYLSGSLSAFLSCLVVNLWQALPFMIMMIDGALHSINKSFYESARLDGAGFWKLHTYITIPMIRPILAPPVLMTTFLTFKQFDIVYLMTMQRGAVTGANINTVLTYVYEKAFITNNYGYSSAAAVLVFVLILLLSLISRSELRSDGV